MAGTGNIDALNELIRDQSPRAMQEVKVLPSPCVTDAKGQSPFNVAIEADNAEIIDLLLEHEETFEFAPTLHTKDQVRLLKTIYNSECIDDIEEAENRLLKRADEMPCWQRTPLLQACRYQHRDAIRELIARGAKPGAKDMFGETPLALCLRTGGTTLADHFIDSCNKAGKKFPLSGELLAELCRSEETYQRAIEQGRLSITAKRFIFNLACATLQREKIEEMLEGGFDVNSATNDITNPVIELLTSRSAWMNEAAGWQEFAAGYAHINGHPAAASVQFSLTPGPGEMSYSKAMARNEKLNESVRRTEINPKFMSKKSSEERLALLRLLLEQGLNIAKVESSLLFPLVTDIISSNEPEFIAELSNAGFNLAPKRGDVEIAWAIRFGCFDMVPVLKKCNHRLRKSDNVPQDMLEKFKVWESSADRSSTLDVKTPEKPARAKKRTDLYWELHGESTLNAETEPYPVQANTHCTLRLKHSNVYGPRAEVQFSLRIAGEADTESSDEESWQTFELVRETVYIDGEDVELGSLDEEPIGETPWTGTFETNVTLPKGKHRLKIKVVAPEPEGCGTLDDWVVRVRE